MNIYIKDFYLLILLTSLFACKSQSEKEHENLQNDMHSFFKANMMDSTSTLDSFRLVKIDTITQRMLFFEQSSVLGNQLDNLLELYKLSNEELSNSVDKMRLYRMINSSDLVEIEKNDFDKKREKGQQIRHEIDTLMSITKAIDSSAKNADPTKVIGFQAKCFYQLRRKDKSVERDTAFILLNLNKDIVKRSDFLKLPYSVDFDKFQ